MRIIKKSTFFLEVKNHKNQFQFFHDYEKKHM